MSDHHFSEGRALGAHYVLTDIIGQGASGVVWRGYRRNDGAVVAAKILRSEFLSDDDLVARFVKERSVLTALAAPEIVTVYDLVAEGQTLAIVMEYLEGISLRSLLQSRGSLSPFLARSIAVQLLDALNVAHAQQVIHKDVKPDNIMLTGNSPADNPQVKLTDFGISTILGTRTRATQLIGTPEYMSPELISQGVAVAGSDVYAAGIVLYEMLSGTTPFAGGQTAHAVLHRHVTAQAGAIEGISTELMHVVWAMLTKDPAHRLTAQQAKERLLSLSAQQLALPGHPLAILTEEYVPATLIKPITSLPAQNISELEHKTEEHLQQDSSTAELTNASLTLPPFSPGNTHTIVRPFSSATAADSSQSPPPENEPRRWAVFHRLAHSRFLMVGLLPLVVIPLAAATGWWVYQNIDFSASPDTPLIQARLEEEHFPSGLSLSREASYDPQLKTVHYTMRFRTAKTEISGPFMEVLEDPQGNCLSPSWPDNLAQKNSAAQTSISARCAWAITPEIILSGKTVKVETVFPLEFSDQDLTRALEEWLRQTQESTTKALLDPEVSSSAYPAQRLQGIRLIGPGHVTSGSVIPLSLIGQWPGGEDQLSPLFVFPPNGPPTTALQPVLGGNIKNLQLIDRCQGAVSVSADGTSVTALFPTKSCELSGTVGNFDIPPFSISITGHSS